MGVAKSFVMRTFTRVLTAALRFAALAWTSTRPKGIGVIRIRRARWLAPSMLPASAPVPTLARIEVHDDRAIGAVSDFAAAGALCSCPCRLRFLARAIWAAYVDLLPGA